MTSSALVLARATISPVGETMHEPAIMSQPPSIPARAVPTTQVPFW
jgi:hypothetical protein